MNFKKAKLINIEREATNKEITNEQEIFAKIGTTNEFFTYYPYGYNPLGPNVEYFFFGDMMGIRSSKIHNLNKNDNMLIVETEDFNFLFEILGE